MLLIVLLSAAFIKSPFCGFVNQFQYVMSRSLVRVLWNVPPVDAVADAGPLPSSCLLRAGTLSRGVWVCVSILFSVSTQLLKTCLSAESETHDVFQLLEVVKRLEGRPKTENVQLQS